GTKTHQPKPRMSPGRPERGKKNSPVIPLLHHCHPERSEGSRSPPYTRIVLFRGLDCHPERSEGSRSPSSQTLRCAQGDMVRSLRLMRIGDDLSALCNSCRQTNGTDKL